MHKLSISLLDMGYRKYGDCTLIHSNDLTVLVDGGHKQDIESNGVPSIPDQLEALLGRNPPFNISLLVVTHCHSDHIGCLPEMVERGMLNVQHALVMDERLGFGRLDDRDSPILDVSSPAVKMLAAALIEEPRVASRDEIAEFLQDVATVEDRYNSMLQSLENSGTNVVRYGRDSVRSFGNEFRSIGLKVIGPTRTHLKQCAEQIFQETRDAVQLAQDLLVETSDADPVELYQLINSGASDFVDAFGRGAAMNCQSILLRFQVGHQKTLMLGDMQLAEPNVRGLDDYMERLRSRIHNDGPFDFVRLAHHGSHNGLNADILTEWTDTTRHFGISAGRGDISHPHRDLLRLLGETLGASWVRTDKNGVCGVTLSNGGVEFSVFDGQLNERGLNLVRDTEVPARTSEPQSISSRPAASTLTAAPMARTKTTTHAMRSTTRATAELPMVTSSETSDRDEVIVTTRVPHRSTKVTITIDVEPKWNSVDDRAQRLMESPSGADQFQLAGGRPLPKLLFATSRTGLASHIGAEPTDLILTACRDAGHVVVDNLDDSNVYTCAEEVRSTLQTRTGSLPSGIVILGGYEVVPALIVDALDPDLRAEIEANHSSFADGDDFIVWSDDIYGDVDGDDDAELPVSRIPDGSSADFLLNALQVDRQSAAGRFGIRNVNRPFAVDVYNGLPGAQPLFDSAPLESHALGTIEIDAQPHVYFMLHGSDNDLSRFWGEEGTNYPVAIETSNVGQAKGAVVFTGCCWGALPCRTIARRAATGAAIADATIDQSIALTFLKAGANAFIGCTGSHYSPPEPPFQYFGGPMHKAFWDYLGNGFAPAESLFQARIDYLMDIPHGHTHAVYRAIEAKIFRQFTCLGLGW